MYDANNVFAKILRGEIPCNKIYEDDKVLSFYDINPKAKVHALVIPKSMYYGACGSGRLAYRNLPDQRFHGKGKCCVCHGNALRKRTRFPRHPHSRLHACIQPAVYALRGSCCRHPPGAGTQMGTGCSALAVRNCLDRRFDYPFYRITVLRRLCP